MIARTPGRGSKRVGRGLCPKRAWDKCIRLERCTYLCIDLHPFVSVLVYGLWPSVSLALSLSLHNLLRCVSLWFSSCLKIPVFTLEKISSLLRIASHG